MRVLHVCQRYWPAVGGSERYIQVISERLAQRGHDVCVFTTDALDLEAFWDPAKPRVIPRRECHHGVEIQRFPIEYLPGGRLGFGVAHRLQVATADLAGIGRRATRWLASYTPWVPELARAVASSIGQFDVVHATNVSAAGLLQSVVDSGRRRDVPVIVTPLVHLGESAKSVVRSYYTMPHQLDLVRGASAVLAMTDTERDFLVERGVESARLRVTGAGIDPLDLAGGDGDRFRRRHQVDGPIVLYVGTSAFDKGTVHLVEAMRWLWRELPAGRPAAPELVLVGPSTDAFANYLRSLPPGALGHVRQLGVVDEAEKRDALAATTVFAMPSRTDSFGIAFLEAWLYGKPVIGARAGGVPALIDDERDGYLVEFGDIAGLARRLNELLSDAERCRDLGDRGRAKALARYSWDQVYPAIEEVYVGLCQTTRAHQRAKSKR
jgi:glycosyltransferase involved in cell wall biosynthesis